MKKATGIIQPRRSASHRFPTSPVYFTPWLSRSSINFGSSTRVVVNAFDSFGSRPAGRRHEVQLREAEHEQKREPVPERRARALHGRPLAAAITAARIEPWGR